MFLSETSIVYIYVGDFLYIRIACEKPRYARIEDLEHMKYVQCLLKHKIILLARQIIKL